MTKMRMSKVRISMSKMRMTKMRILNDKNANIRTFDIRIFAGTPFGTLSMYLSVYVCMDLSSCDYTIQTLCKCASLDNTLAEMGK